MKRYKFEINQKYTIGAENPTRFESHSLSFRQEIYIYNDYLISSKTNNK